MAEQKHSECNGNGSAHVSSKLSSNSNSDTKLNLHTPDKFEERAANPCGVFFDSVIIGNEIYLFPDFMTQEVAFLKNFCNNSYVDLSKFNRDCYRYDRASDSFQVVTRLPASVTTMYKGVSYNPLTRKVWIVGGTHDIFCSYSVPDAKWDLASNFRGAISDSTTGPLPAAIHVVRDQRSVLHLIGGHNSAYHEVLDLATRRMRPVFKFKSRLKGQAVEYCASMDALIMFGGSQWDERDFRHTIRFRYTALFYVCRRPNDAMQRGKSHKVTWEKSSKWRLPYNMMGFGHVLVDSRYLLIFGGRINGGDLIDEIWMLDLVESVWSRSTLRIPVKGKYHAMLLNTSAELVEASQLNSEEVRSADAADKEADKADVEVRLLMFDHGEAHNRKHFRIGLKALLATFEVVGDEALPSECLASEWTKVSVNNEKLWQQQRAKLLADSGRSMEAMAKEINADKALSNRQKAKLIRKLKQKRYKYENSDFSGPANSSLLLPPSLVECKEDEEERARQVRAEYEARIEKLRAEYEKKLAALRGELEALRAKVTEADTKKLLNGLAAAGAKKQEMAKAKAVQAQ